MAEIPSETKQGPDGSVLITQWIGLGQGDVGEAVNLGEWADRSIQVTGNFSGAASIDWQGSNDDAQTWAQLNDPHGSALSVTAAGIHGVLQATAQARPSVAGGDGSTDLNVYLFSRRPPIIDNVVEQDSSRFVKI